MSDLERLKDLVENKNYLVQSVNVTTGVIKITLIHRGGGPPPEGEVVIIKTTDFECEGYAFNVLHNQ